MTSLYSPPETYQQWLSCFQQLCDNPKNLSVLEVMERGSYMGTPSESFLCRLSDTVGTVLTARCRLYLRQVDNALMDAEPDMVPLLTTRFRKDLRRCFFYRKLSCLPGDFVRELDEGFTEQLQKFWSSFLAQLKKSADISSNPQLEELHWELRRVSIMQREG